MLTTYEGCKDFFQHNEGKYAIYKTNNAWLSERPYQDRYIKILKAFDMFVTISIVDAIGKEKYKESINYCAVMDKDDSVEIIETPSVLQPV